MKSRKTLSKMLVLVALVATGVVWVSVRKAHALSSLSMSSGMVGITQGHTARLNVVNAFSSEDVAVEMTLLDSNGKVLFNCDGAIPQGKSFSDDFTPVDLGQGVRLEVRGLVRVLDRRQAEAVGVTLELFNSETGVDDSIYGFRPIINLP